ncbi:MAG: copper amine oxidase N-terminal domain-containing protein [Fimbriimonadaceae bacterium]|nr:copper amine oxidase N-terminal domain-containing protein [Chthonomonadaceae bacterium]MCO5297295.1 copper amine oxidase N-terminal domain-containing protein [Fimbriimonadaceae bacterium]
MLFLPPIDVYVNQERVTFPDQQPLIAHSRVLVPVRGVFEKMGARVEWTPLVTAVTIDKDTLHIEMSIADRTVTVNGQTRAIDQGVKVVEGRLLVPIRFISETLGATVRWDPDGRTVHIDAPPR